MKSTVEIEVEDIVPASEAILRAQGVPTGHSIDTRTRDLAERALASFRQLAAPRAILSDTTSEEFAEIYTGEGTNAEATPLDYILPHADALALFAVTVGPQLTEEIGRLFDQHDFAAAAMLDAAASEGADLLAERLQNCREDDLRANSLIDHSLELMRFSPGYCGWHVSGQKKLFALLQPEEIGIHLSSSCLMDPLKSVSGVILAAPLEKLEIDDTWPFCAGCTTHSCRDRFEAARQNYLARNERN